MTKLLERLAYQVNHTVHTADADAVHDLRVAIRRFSQALAVTKAAFPAKDVKKIRGRLKELMELTNPARDCDVALKLLPKNGRESVAAMEPAIRAYRKEQIRLLIPVLRRWGARKTSSKWRAALLPNGSAQEEFEFGTEAPRLIKRFLKHGARADSAERLHQLRIDGKKVRYTIELLPDTRWTALLETLTQTQKLLGDVNDCRAVRKLVQEVGGHAEIENWLKRRQKKKARAFAEQWPLLAASLQTALTGPRRKPAVRSAPAAKQLALHA